ncbi:MAG: polysaccharide lyase [Planctomycetaceae bacterium]
MSTDCIRGKRLLLNRLLEPLSSDRTTTYCTGGPARRNAKAEAGRFFDVAEAVRFGDSLAAIAFEIRTVTVRPILTVLGVMLLSCLAVKSVQAEEAVLLEDFDQRAKSDFYLHLNEHERLEVVSKLGVRGSQALRASYVGSKLGSDRIIVTEPLSRHLTDATLCFDVQLEEGFKFMRGGRMHGLGPNDRAIGQRPDDPDAWCARIRFRGDGTLETSLSHQDQRANDGDRGRRVRPFKLLVGRYYAISLHVKLNDPDKSNGLTKLYINGILVEEHSDVCFRKVDSLDSEISHYMFNTFFGGGTHADAPRNLDGSLTSFHALYDNLAVYEGEHIRRAAGE